MLHAVKCPAKRMALFNSSHCTAVIHLIPLSYRLISSCYCIPTTDFESRRLNPSEYDAPVRRLSSYAPIFIRPYSAITCAMAGTSHNCPRLLRTYCSNFMSASKYNPPSFWSNNSRNPPIYSFYSNCRSNSGCRTSIPVLGTFTVDEITTNFESDVKEVVEVAVTWDMGH